MALSTYVYLDSFVCIHVFFLFASIIRLLSRSVLGVVIIISDNKEIFLSDVVSWVYEVHRAFFFCSRDGSL